MIPRRIVALDDYQGVAHQMADWHSLGTTDVEFITRHVSDREELVELLHDADIVCAMRERTPFDAALFERLPQLRLLVTTGMRNAAIDLAAAADHGVTVCGTSSDSVGTAELTFGLILALARGIAEGDADVRRGVWQRSTGIQLAGRRLGVLGLGHIGSLVAGHGRAFGMDIVAWSPSLSEDHARSIGVEPVGRDELLQTSDVVTLHVRLTEQSRGMIGPAELALMRSDALLVNTSRDALVDRDALFTALNEGRLGGAALDVHPVEPMPADDPALSVPNLLLSPHKGYVNDRGYARYYGETVECITAWRDGRPVRVLVAPDR